MKKVIALLSFALCCSVTALMAQPPGGGPQMDPAARLAMMKERVKPKLIEKTKLSDEQADKVLEIQILFQTQMMGMRDMNEEQRTAKMKEANEERTKKLKAIPLTDDQVKSVNDFYAEMRKNRPQGPPPAGGGN